MLFLTRRMSMEAIHKAQYRDIEKMQVVSVLGHRLGKDAGIVVVVKNTMENHNLTYEVSIDDFMSRRFEEV
jgi:hypothetical protein